MKVRPGRQLNTIERMGVEDQTEEKVSETELHPTIADPQQALSYETTQEELEAPEGPRPLLIKEAPQQEDKVDDVLGENYLMMKNRHFR